MLAECILCAVLAVGADQKQSPAPAKPAVAKPAENKPAEAKPAEATPAEAKQVDLLQIEKNIVEYTNSERAKFGLASLEIDKDLMDSAREHGQWMARNTRMVHTSKPVAENIAMGQSHSSDAVRDWMNSSGHRRNILNSGHRRIGVAAYQAANGRIYWCQQFRP